MANSASSLDTCVPTSTSILATCSRNALKVILAAAIHGFDTNVSKRQGIGRGGGPRFEFEVGTIYYIVTKSVQLSQKKGRKS